MLNHRESQHPQLQQQQQQQQLVPPDLQLTLLRSPQSAFQPALDFPGSSQPMATPSALFSGTFGQGESHAGAPALAASSFVANEAAAQAQGLHPQAQQLQLHGQQAAQGLAASTLQAFAEALGLGAGQVQQQHSAEALIQRAADLTAQQAASPHAGARDTMRIMYDAALAQQEQRRRGLEADAPAGPLLGPPALRPPAVGQQARGCPPLAQLGDHGRPRLEEALTSALGQALRREASRWEDPPSAEPAAPRQDEHGESANMDWGQSEEGVRLGPGQVGGVGPALLGQAAQVMAMLDSVFRQQLQALGRLQEELRSTIALFAQVKTSLLVVYIY